MKVCLPQLVRTRGRCKSLQLIASASLIRMKTTIASDVKIKINFPRQIFMHHNTAMEVSSL